MPTLFKWLTRLFVLIDDAWAICVDSLAAMGDEMIVAANKVQLKVKLILKFSPMDII